MVTASAALDSFDDCLHFLGLPVELSQYVRKRHMCLGHMIQGLISVLILEQDQSESELTLGGLNISLPEFDLEEVQYHS